MRMVNHPIYGPGTPTGKANGVFIQVRFERDIGDQIATYLKNTIYVSQNVCK